jgi:hypothetical protein
VAEQGLGLAQVQIQVVAVQAVQGTPALVLQEAQHYSVINQIPAELTLAIPAVKVDKMLWAQTIVYILATDNIQAVAVVALDELADLEAT